MQLLRLLGGLSLDGPLGPVGGRGAQRRRLALLALLAAEHPRPVRRDRLLAYLWPESDTDRARHLLRDSLYVLRGTLGDDAIVARADELRLDPARLGCDLWEFEAALQRGDLGAAVAGYAGPFLDGVFLGGGAELERWVEQERARLARRHADALEALAEGAELASDHRAAAEWWRRLSDADAYSERVALRLMRALESAGDRAGALRHAAAHAARLGAELDAGPDPAVSALAERLRQEPAHREPAAIAPSVPAPAAEAGTPTTRPTPSGVPTSRPRLALLAGAVVLGGLVVATALAVRARAAPSPDPQRVVVVPLANRTGDASLDAIGGIAADWITQGLVATGEVPVVTLAGALTATRYLASLATPPESAALPRAIADETGAGIVVLGSYLRVGDSLRFQVTITDATTGRVLAAPPPSLAAVGAPLDGIEALRSRVMAELATSLNPRLSRHAAAASRPPTYEAYRGYAEGAAHAVDGDWRGALEPLRRAAALDTGFTLPLVVLGMMHFNLGEFAAADSIARRAERSRHRLVAFDRALLDNLEAWLRRDHEAAYRAAAVTAQFAPGSTSASQMGIEAGRMNRPREAIRILSALDPTRGELRGDPYYWWALTLARHQLGEHARELRAARRARALVPDHPVVAVTEIRALAALGRDADVRRRLDEALASPSRLSPPPAMLFQHAVLELGAHGRRAAARALADRAVAWHHARPPQEQATDAHRRSLAQALYHAERWEEARALLAGLAASHPEDVTVQGQLGVVAARQDRPADARRIAAWLATVDQPYTWAAPVGWRAAIAAQLGEPEAALTLLRESVTRGRLREGFHSDPALEPLRRLPAFRALLRPQG